MAGHNVFKYNPSHPEEQREGCAKHAEFTGTSCRIQVMEREHRAEPTEPDSACIKQKGKTDGAGEPVLPPLPSPSEQVRRHPGL